LFFETISTKIRMEIMCLLREGPKSVSEICKVLEEEQSKISHNLRKMVECHILDVKQEGKQRIYSLNKDTIIPILDLVEKHVHKYCGQECMKKK
jgi:DNA-binding transcriptional ArsR family regulator